MTRAALLMLITAVLAPCAPAHARDAQAEAPAPASGRYALRHAGADAAPLRSGRYTLRARFAPADGEAELRESTRFSLIGRFNSLASPTASVCDRIFANGFEVP